MDCWDVGWIYPGVVVWCWCDGGTGGFVMTVVVLCWCCWLCGDVVVCFDGGVDRGVVLVMVVV